MLTNLKILRQERNLSQQRLADAIEISQQSINKYENENVQPDFSVLIRMADFFDTSIDYLIGYTEVRYKIENTEAYHLSDDESNMIMRYRALDNNERECLKMLIDILLKKK